VNGSSRMPYIDKHLHVLRSRELKDRNHAAGFCAHCGKTAPAIPSRVWHREGAPTWTCPKCSAKQKARLKAIYSANLATGLCGVCGKHPLETKTLCHSCREDSKARAREARLRLIEAGRCVKCRRPNDAPTTRCTECNEKHNASKRRGKPDRSNVKLSDASDAFAPAQCSAVRPEIVEKPNETGAK
jgi:hypothetical protein